MIPETRRRLNMMIGGIRIITSAWLPEPGGEIGYPDWRARLNRNLSRASTGKWEPLTHQDERPNAYMIDGTLFAHPKSIVAIRGLASLPVSGETRDA